MSAFDKKMIVLKYEDLPSILSSDYIWQRLELDKIVDNEKEYHIGYGNDMIYNFDANTFVFKEDLAYKENLSSGWKFAVYIFCWPILLLRSYRF
jgi:hypothetical protein